MVRSCYSQVQMPLVQGREREARLRVQPLRMPRLGGHCVSADVWLGWPIVGWVVLSQSSRPHCRCTSYRPTTTTSQYNPNPTHPPPPPQQTYKSTHAQYDHTCMLLLVCVNSTNTQPIRTCV